MLIAYSKSDFIPTKVIKWSYSKTDLVGLNTSIAVHVNVATHTLTQALKLSILC